MTGGDGSEVNALAAVPPDLPKGGSDQSGAATTPEPLCPTLRRLGIRRHRLSERVFFLRILRNSPFLAKSVPTDRARSWSRRGRGRLRGRPDLRSSYAEVLGADAGDTGVLTHNPMEASQLPGFRTHWGRREPYTLGELAEFVPHRWRQPKPARTAIGRNCDLFAHCMQWAGSPGNLGAPVLEEARTANDGLQYPLGTSEMAGIARFVERYRRKWIQQGRFWGSGNSSYDCSSEAQAKRGIKSGEVRRKRTQERDRAIVQLALAGTKQRAIARVTGVDEKMVRHVLRRDAPLFDRPAPLTETRPWEAEGISRSTWERRRRDANSERTTQVSPGK